MKSKRTTQADVARKAGVSRGTVSLVLNKTAAKVPISEETRQRVFAAANELGYFPDPVAQMLAKGHTNIIGFLSFDETFPYAKTDFYNPYLVGVEQEAGEQGYNVLLFTRRYSAENRAKLLSSLLLADGLILTGNQPDAPFLRRLQKEGYNLVLLGTCDIPADQIDSVESDHEPASYTATQHLLSLGHRRIGFVAEDMTYSHHQERLAGSERAVAEVAGARLLPIGAGGLVSAEILQQTIEQNGLSALICADRSLYADLITHLQTLAIDIPGSLSLIFLSDIWGLPFHNPTRVQLNRDLAGQIAVQRLVQRMGDELDGFQQQRVACQFIVGDTTAPPNGR